MRGFNFTLAFFVEFRSWLLFIISISRSLSLMASVGSFEAKSEGARNPLSLRRFVGCRIECVFALVFEQSTLQVPGSTYEAAMPPWP